MLELPNFGHMTTFTIYLESHDKILLVTSWTEAMTSYPLLHNTFNLRRSKVAIFAEIIKIVIIFIKTIFKDSRKLIRNRNYVSKCNLYLYFVILQNLLISGEKILISADFKGRFT